MDACLGAFVHAPVCMYAAMDSLSWACLPSACAVACSRLRARGQACWHACPGVHAGGHACSGWHAGGHASSALHAGGHACSGWHAGGHAYPRSEAFACRHATAASMRLRPPRPASPPPPTHTRVYTPRPRCGAVAVPSSRGHRQILLPQHTRHHDTYPSTPAQAPLISFHPSSPVLNVSADCPTDHLLEFLASEAGSGASTDAAEVHASRAREDALLEDVRSALDAKVCAAGRTRDREERG
eukprot:354273-Chlamydomonas_euryale.AAC.1